VAPSKPRPDDLERYDQKRDPRATPEPFGAGPARPGLFVVHQHQARRLHFDLRLELDGTLKSWAVPKGPSYEQADKRLAIHVEDHPLDYGDFEGVIPAGNYGAGSVIVWDRGRWTPLEDPRAGLERGKLLFELHGYKLRGRWALVKIKRGKNEWLLLKERDGWEGKEQQKLLAPESVLSGLTVEELAKGGERIAAIARDAEAAGAVRRRLDARQVGLMLAATSERPFSSPDWLFELKYDGYRVLLASEERRPLLLLRGGGEATRSFPEIARAVAALPCSDAILDCEVVVLDDDGRASFGRLQQRARRDAADAVRAAVQDPATAYCFDLLALEGFDLRPLPLATRKALLRRLLPAVGPLRYLDHVDEQGEALYREVAKRGLEGVVAKKKDSAYREGRSDHWRKLRVDRTDDFAIVGCTTPQGSRAGFGALHLAAWVPENGGAGHFVYAGSVGSGFRDAELEALARTLRANERKDPPCTGQVPKTRGHTWCEPRLVCEVRFKEWTKDGLLRQPVFLRLRPDKRPEECVASRRAGEAEPPERPATEPSPKPSRTRRRKADPPAAEPGPGQEPTAAAAHATHPPLKLTNLDKVFWPGPGYTKGDLIGYYQAVADWILPYLKSRPLVMTRYPDGIEGKSFFQKDAPPASPDWVRKWHTWSEDAQREVDYVLCDDAATLTWLANLGTIPLHVWASRVETLERPDWCVLDLDPKEAPFAQVVVIARALRELCESLGLTCFAKTSGSSGMHLLLPLGAQWTFEQSRLLAELLARVVVRRLPAIATVTRAPKQRGGKVYVDYGQNGRGKLIAAPLCVRARPAATVSTPLAWSEVQDGLDPLQFTIRTVPARLRAQKLDPWLGLLAQRADLPRALAALAGLVEPE
jgi:bifunctional non-homologous end joining protein LigD